MDVINWGVHAPRLCYLKKGPAVSDWLRELEWNALAYAIVAGLALVGLVALWLFVPAVRRAWLPMPRLRPGAWSGLEVFLALCIMQGFPVLVV